MKRFAIAALTALSLCGVAVEAKPQALAKDATGAGLLVQAKELTKSGARIKARKIYEGIVRDSAMRRNEPESVASAYDALHALMVADGASAIARKRLIEDAVRDLHDDRLRSSLCEREGDALLAKGALTAALDFYQSSPLLTEAGEAIRDMLKNCQSALHRLNDDDMTALAKVAKSKPEALRPLCAALSKCRDGWKAEDFLASRLLEKGRFREAAETWGHMLDHRCGPLDAIAFSRCEALAEYDAKAAILGLDKWLADWPKSRLYAKARLARARLEASHGNLQKAAELYSRFLEAFPQGVFAEEARREVAEVQESIARIGRQQEKEDERKRVAAANPELARTEEAEALLRQGRYRDAAEAFKALRNSADRTIRARAGYGLGLSQRGQGRLTEALDTLRGVAKTESAHVGGLLAYKAERVIGDIFLEDIGDYGEAVRSYENCRATDMEHADSGFWLNYGLAMMVSGRGEEAERIFVERREGAADDKVEFVKWDNLARKCREGKGAANGILEGRKALADIQLAEALHDGGEFKRALKLFGKAEAAATRAGLGDRCGIGIAKCRAASGDCRGALKAYDAVVKKYPKSQLAPHAMLCAGVLCASPAMNDFGRARKYFDALTKAHPAVVEAVAAEFYSATLAWRAGKWKEAEDLHKTFAKNHPDSPLTRVALEERLPAIASKSLGVPKKASGVYENEFNIIVSPYDRIRMACHLFDAQSSYNALLNLTPESGWKFVSSGIVSQDSRRSTRLWTVASPKNPFSHTYHLCNAFSSEEFVMVDGRLVPDGNPGKPKTWPFRVTIPSVDVDWNGFDNASFEDGEDSRHVLVPLNANGADDVRRILLQSPFDDDERDLRPTAAYGSCVQPEISLEWRPKNALSLSRHGGSAIPNGWSVNARQVNSWPLSFDVLPQSATSSFLVYCRGETTDGGGKADDKICGRIVDVDLDIDANYDGVINEDDEPLEETQGGLVGRSPIPVRLRLSPQGLPGKTTLLAISGGSRIKVWLDQNRNAEVALPKTWNAEESIPSTLYVEGVSPSIVTNDVKLSLRYDENPDGQYNPLLRCEDCVKLTSAMAQMIGYAAWRGIDDRQVPDGEKFDPGFLVTAYANAHLSAKIRFKGIPDVGFNRYYKFSQAGYVLANGQATTTAEVAIPQDDDFDLTLDMTDPSTWGNDSYVDVEYILRDAQGDLFDSDKCRLLRPYVVAVGDSLTYGLMRWQHKFQTPKWKHPWNSYPTAATWEDTNMISPEYAVSAHRLDKGYQGYRGYLSEMLPGFTWLGLDTNGHGPRHKGYPGAVIIDIMERTDSSVLGISPSFMFVIYLAGMNNCTHASVTSMTPSPMEQWIQSVVNIKNLRQGNGKTILLALQLPQVDSVFMNYIRNDPQGAFAIVQENINQFNGIVGAYGQNYGNFIGKNVELNINHQNDDGLHFSSTGYQTMATLIFGAIMESLQ